MYASYKQHSHISTESKCNSQPLLQAWLGLFPLQQWTQTLGAQLGTPGSEWGAPSRDWVVLPGGKDTAGGVGAVPQYLLVTCWAKQPPVTGWYLSFVAFPIPFLF